MTIASRSKHRETLEKIGKVTVTVGSVTITIEKRDDRYEISMQEKGSEPNQWLYRSKAIAIERFEEQVSHYRRVKK